jgi:hypothetical protein
MLCNLNGDDGLGWMFEMFEGVRCSQSKKERVIYLLYLYWVVNPHQSKISYSSNKTPQKAFLTNVCKYEYDTKFGQ